MYAIETAGELKLLNIDILSFSSCKRIAKRATRGEVRKDGTRQGKIDYNDIEIECSVFLHPILGTLLVNHIQKEGWFLCFISSM